MLSGVFLTVINKKDKKSAIEKPIGNYFIVNYLIGTILTWLLKNEFFNSHEKNQFMGSPFESNIGSS